MKKIAISTAALTAATALILVTVPTAARATSAKATFNAMKKALIAKNRQAPFLLKDDRPGGQMYVLMSDTGPDAPGWTLHNGQPFVNPNAAGPERHRIKLAVDESGYSKIEYGSSHSVLLLTPKDAPQKQYQVKLDPTSHLPISISLLVRRGKALVRDGGGGH